MAKNTFKTSSTPCDEKTSLEFARGIETALLTKLAKQNKFYPNFLGVYLEQGLRGLINLADTHRLNSDVMWKQHCALYQFVKTDLHRTIELLKAKFTDNCLATLSTRFAHDKPALVPVVIGNQFLHQSFRYSDPEYRFYNPEKALAFAVYACRTKNNAKAREWLNELLTEENVDSANEMRRLSTVPYNDYSFEDRDPRTIPEILPSTLIVRQSIPVPATVPLSSALVNATNVTTNPVNVFTLGQ